MERYASWKVDILQEGEGQPLLDEEGLLLQVEEELIQQREEELLQQGEEEHQLDGTVQRDSIFGHIWSPASGYEEEPCIERLCAVEVLPKGQFLEVLPRGQLCERLPLVPILGICQSCFEGFFLDSLGTFFGCDCKRCSLSRLSAL